MMGRPARRSPRSPRCLRGATLVEVLLTTLLLGLATSGAWRLDLATARLFSEGYGLHRASALLADKMAELRYHALSRHQATHGQDHWRGPGLEVRLYWQLAPVTGPLWRIQVTAAWQATGDPHIHRIAGQSLVTP